MPDTFAVTIAVAIISSGVWPVMLPKIMEHRTKKRIESGKQTEDERDTWFRESRIAYDRVKQECATCSKRLDDLSQRFYELLDDLDSIALQDSDSTTINKSDLRSVLRKSRNSQFLKEKQNAVDDERLDRGPD